MRLLWSVLLLLVLCGGALASPCPRYTAPRSFNNSPASWGNDSGPIVDGFIDVVANGSPLVLVHGVDLSRYNQIDYSRFAACGGTFSFVQMDAMFSKHVDGLQTHNSVAIPYFFLKLPRDLRTVSNLAESPSGEEITALRTRYAEAGKTSALSFVAALKAYSQSVGKPFPTDASIAGLTGKFIALDVEESPLGHFSPGQARQYGRFYATAVCSWIKTVEQNTAGVVPILYTFPAIYGDYLSFAYAEENKCLQGYPVWIARTYPNGWEAIRDPKHLGPIDKDVQRLCRVQGGNRCLVHQYTHRGIFMAAHPAAGGTVPPHFDLDRFYASQILQTDAGPQFVRVADPFR
jgi:hypothetical protein